MIGVAGLDLDGDGQIRTKIDHIDAVGRIEDELGLGFERPVIAIESYGIFLDLRPEVFVPLPFARSAVPDSVLLTALWWVVVRKLFAECTPEDVGPSFESIDVRYKVLASRTPLHGVNVPNLGNSESLISKIVCDERAGTYARQAIVLANQENVQWRAVGVDCKNPIHEFAHRHSNPRGEYCVEAHLSLKTVFGLAVGNQGPALGGMDEPLC